MSERGLKVGRVFLDKLNALINETDELMMEQAKVNLAQRIVNARTHGEDTHLWYLLDSLVSQCIAIKKEVTL